MPDASPIIGKTMTKIEEIEEPGSVQHSEHGVESNALVHVAPAHKCADYTGRIIGAFASMMLLFCFMITLFVCMAYLVERFLAHAQTQVFAELDEHASGL